MTAADTQGGVITASEARVRIDELQRAIPHACGLCLQGWAPKFMAVGLDAGWWHGQHARCGAHALRLRVAHLKAIVNQAASLN